MAHRLRKVIRLIERAGGTVKLRGGAHLHVTGPGGVALVGAEINDSRAWQNTVAALRRYAGLQVEGSP